MQYPTPYFVYDAALIRARIMELVEAFRGLKVSLHYAVKANDLRDIIQLAADGGIGACLVSKGEMQRALQGGMKPSLMLMNGVGKSVDDICFALENNIGQLNVESLPELNVIADSAKSMNKRAVICLRINPEIEAKAHSHTTTARRTDKFGLLVEELPAAREIIAKRKELDWRGFSCHIGSQIHGVDELAASYQFMIDLWKKEKSSQSQFDRLDLGGGFGVSYHGDSYARPADYARLLEKIIPPDVMVQLEPGRFIAAEAGRLITKVLYVKNSGGTRFLVVDAAMNNLIRPALYDAYHPIALTRSSTAPLTPCTIVGPVCESADCFARDREMPSDIREGDILTIGFAGAYGSAMASQYNARDRLAEIIVDGAESRIARRAFSAEEFDKLTLA
ncbi:MAG: diaminopimelate decarboxylase [Dongiaceae bacterium]